jgi:putative spermidine/putrescine transport system permease protein
VNSAFASTMNRVVVVAIFAFLWLPILVIFVVSFDTSTFLRFPPQGFTLDAYATVFSTPAFVNGLWTSLIIAVFATAITLVVSTAAALVFTRARFRGAGAAQAFFLSPLLVPNIVLGLALLLFFAPLGLTDGYLGLVLAHVVLCIPYAVRTITVSLTTVDVSSEDAARVLGASRFVTFRRVTLPLIRPGIIAGGVPQRLRGHTAAGGAAGPHGDPGRAGGGRPVGAADPVLARDRARDRAGARTQQDAALLAGRVLSPALARCAASGGRRARGRARSAAPARRCCRAGSCG